MCEWCFTAAVTEMLTDGDSLSLEDALGVIQPISPDNSTLVNSPPTVCLLLLLSALCLSGNVLASVNVVVSAELFSHGTGTLQCLQKEMAT